MKKFLAISAILAIAFGATQALAASPRHSSKPQSLIVAMHDPGCHWFLVHGKYVTHTSVTGAVRVFNNDEKALKVASGHGMQQIAVGKSLLLTHGHYIVTMVAQAKDDNHLKLTVR